jgi:hypothetical protein
MLIIKHRVNTSIELNALNPNFGVEIDIRTYGENIVVSHDPFNRDAEDFKTWLSYFKHRTLIINLKEEGLEDRLNMIMNRFPQIDYFFLDQSFPFMVKTLKAKEFRTCIRFSDLESIETLKLVVEKLSCKPNWIWIDDFTGEWEHLKILKTIDLNGIKTCLVSPELQGRDLSAEVDKILRGFDYFSPSAICTKKPEYWESLI